MPSVGDTLVEIDRWYNELPGGTERPSLLSKLAILELCGWLEERLDTLVTEAAAIVGVPAEWTTLQVVKPTFGFSYQDHLRKMLCRLVGEAAMLHAESIFDSKHPGRLEQLKGALTTLAKSRGVLAHTHSASPAPAQTTLNAPSWTINQHRVIAKHIDAFEECLRSAFDRTIRTP